MRKIGGVVLAVTFAVGVLLAGQAFGADRGVAFDESGIVRPGSVARVGAAMDPWRRPSSVVGLQSQAEVPVPILETVEWVDGEYPRIDGLVYNPAGALSNVEDVIVRLTWLDADENPVGDPWNTWAHTWVLAPDVLADFSFYWAFPPETATHYTLEALGIETEADRVSLDTTYIDSGYGPDGPAGGRWYVWAVTNNTSSDVDMVHLSAWEHEGQPAGSRTLLDIMDVQGSLGGSWPLQPGKSVTAFLVGRNQPAQGNDVYATVQAEAYVEPPPVEDTSTPIPVYRYYASAAGRHYYTTMEGSYAHSDFSYDGIAFYVYLWAGDTERPGTVPVYLLMNRLSHTWFYTVSETELDQIMSTHSDVYGFVGPLWRVPEADDGHGQLVYRFYNGRNGEHFYTASEAERDAVITYLGYLYYYEGPAFWTPVPAG